MQPLPASTFLNSNDMGSMSDSAEHLAWQTILESIAQESASLKYRLSDMVDQLDGPEYLQMAEYFQSEFLVLDDKMRRLTKELQLFLDEYKIASTSNFSGEQLFRQQENLRRKITGLENRFIGLADDFWQRMVKKS